MRISPRTAIPLTRSDSAISLKDTAKGQGTTGGIALKPAAGSLSLAKSKGLGAGAADDGGDKALRAACNDFEAIFISQILGSADTSEKAGLFGSDVADKVFKSQLNDALAATMAKRGALGIGDVIYRQLKKPSTGPTGE